MQMRDNFDDKLKKALLKGTEKSVELKYEIWKNIDKRLAFEDREGLNTKKSSYLWMKKITGVAVAAVVFSALFFTFSQPGQAAVEKIKDFFASQKKIVQDIEGIPEEKDVNLQESDMGYVIYIDEELYIWERQNETDRIVPKIKAENLPAVFMEISQISDKDPKSVELEIKDNLNKDFEYIIDEGEVDKPVKGIHLRGRTGNERDDTVVQYYLIDNTKGGTFVIKQQYFLEAAEGHGARFYLMLQEFKIVNTDKE